MARPTTDKTLPRTVNVAGRRHEERRIGGEHRRKDKGNQHQNPPAGLALIQHSTSPCSSPLVVIPKKSGGVRITVNYKKLNQISKLSQLPIPRVDHVLDSLGSGRVFSLFDLVFQT